MGQLDSQEVFIPETFADKPSRTVFQAEQEYMPSILALLDDPRVQILSLTTADCKQGWPQASLAAVLLDPDFMGKSTVQVLKVFKYLYEQGMTNEFALIAFRIHRYLRPFAVKQGWLNEGDSLDHSNLTMNLIDFADKIGFGYLVPAAFRNR